MNTPITLTIAGSDSGGGAGIQADIKAISATGGYACSVITALTAQNTLGVNGICAVSPDFVCQQLDAVFSDLNVRAVKIGMLADSDIISAVAGKLRQYRPDWVVLDPVMVATSGDLLLQTSAVESLKHELLPLANVITPNLPEVAQLLGLPDIPREDDIPDVLEACQAMLGRMGSELCSQSLLLKGGHLHTDSMSRDWLISVHGIELLQTQRVHTNNTHGTGCTLSAAIASYLAQGMTVSEAVTDAKAFLTRALQHADRWQIGQGHGPVDHFFSLHQDCNTPAIK